MKRALDWLGRLSLETRLLIGLIVFTIAYRWITLPIPMDGGDLARKWVWGRVVLAGWSPAHAIWNGWDHHAARLAIVIPNMLIQAVLGTHPNVVFVAPLLYHTIGAVLIFQIARRVCGLRPAFWTASLWVFLIDPNWAAQLMPEPFSAAYILLTTYCLVRASSVETDKARWRWVLAAAGSMILAYFAKLPNLFFVPGMFLAIWLTTRRFRMAVAFGAVVVTALVLETLIYRHFTDFELGRVSVIKARHLSHPRMDGVIESFWDFFRKYRPVFDTPLGPVIAVFLPIAGAGLVFLRRLPQQIQVLLLVVVSFFFFQTFAVQSLDPLRPVQPPRSRYMAVTMGPMMILIAWTATLFVRFSPPSWLKERVNAIYPTVWAGLLTFAWFMYWPDWEKHPVVQIAEYKKIADEWAESGEPVIAYDYRTSTMKSFTAFFWDGFDGKVHKKRRRLPRFYALGSGRQKVWFLMNVGSQSLSKQERRQLLNKYRGKELLVMRHKRTDIMRLRRERFRGI